LTESRRQTKQMFVSEAASRLRECGIEAPSNDEMQRRGRPRWCLAADPRFDGPPGSHEEADLPNRRSVATM
jgi:hypothetical protein